MCDQTHEAIITGLAEEFGCTCESTTTEFTKYAIPIGGTRSTHRWITAQNLSLDVAILGDRLHIHVPPRGDSASFELADPNLIDRVGKLIKTYHRLMEIGAQAENG